MNNLIDDPKYAANLQELQKKLEESMMESGDPILEAFRKRKDSEFVEAYVQELENQSVARRKKDNTF